MIIPNKLAFVLINCYLTFLHFTEAFPYNEGRIVGGVPTTIDNAKYLVQIRNDNSILCSGVLVGEIHVLTAAHCFDTKPKRLSVVGGATKITDSGTARSKVGNIFIPTNYNNVTFDWDIAVIKLKKPLVGDFIEPISIECDDWKAGDPVTLYGWGKKGEDAESIPIQLQTVKVEIIDEDWCKRTYQARRRISETMFCAADKGKDACSGDSGGPVIVNNQMCGIVSWGIGCARKESPGVYTDLKKVLKFVEAALQK